MVCMHDDVVVQLNVQCDRKLPKTVTMVKVKVEESALRRAPLFDNMSGHLGEQLHTPKFLFLLREVNSA
jgi:hypothetical protein